MVKNVTVFSLFVLIHGSEQHKGTKRVTCGGTEHLRSGVPDP